MHRPNRPIALAAFLLFGFGAIVTPAVVTAKETKRLAVLELRGTETFDSQTLNVLSDQLRQGALAAFKGTPYEVMTRENMAMLTRDMGIDLAACEEGAECEVDIGRNVGAQLVLSGGVVRFGTKLTVTLKLHDTNKGSLLAAETVRAHTEDDLLDALPTAAEMLIRDGLGLRRGSRPVDRSTPAPTEGRVGKQASSFSPGSTANSGASHYDPDKLASASQVFRAIAEQLQAGYEPVAEAVQRVDGLLADLDLNLALSEGLVQKSHYALWTARLDERSGVFGPEFEAVQEASYAVQDRSIEAFEGALRRAVESLAAGSGGVGPVACSGGRGGLESLGPMGMGNSGNATASRCPGPDMTATIAALCDQDPTLQQELNQLKTQAWPSVTDYQEPADPLGVDDAPASSQWLSPAQLARGIPEVAEQLDEVAGRAQEGRDSLQQALRDSDPEDPKRRELKLAIRTRAMGIRRYSSEQRAAIGAALWQAVQRATKKGRKDGWGEVSICLNPTGWGGCTGRDRTDDVLGIVYEDRKLGKDIAKLRSALPQPDVSLP